ncbi:MAG: nitroreductase family protein, partial [Candidatus Bathyarchaeia archaeon]
IALQNMVIAAWGLGIGSRWIGDFKEAQVKRLLNIPEDRKVIALVTFGYPAEKIESRQKKPIDDIVSYNKF